MKTKKPRKLTQAQKNLLKKHSSHHTKRHMAVMRGSMVMGSCFKCAHKKAMKKVGN